ncbi:putative bifunctional diguanylate cyclase/phosphodiesterase [Pseudomonas oligotrophica]|uniref:putative bifunctional diguanylate cyclase/phosphodiesterase n=1 Tax=Pseudomonas oligotrophica TaxID=2912055 RepID=UPI001F4639A7|nr:EAL domain-containing protein [Pseudomonas oligotrophica]MCF7201044.1 EAL domain-containing protein [Pseudomonas oligotrophica]
MEDQLTAVLQRVGLDLERILTRKRFLQWQAADRERLGRAANDPALTAGQARFVERLYDHLAEFAEASARLGPPASLERLKHSQLSYYQRLLSGPYDRDYVRDRLLVGLVHERAGIDLEWYLGAYRLYLGHMLEQLFGEDERSALFGSLLKIVFFDMILAIDTYVAAQRQALEDSEARLARALRGTEDGIWDWNVEYDRLYVSERWTQMLGLAPLGSGHSRDWFERVHPDDLPLLRDAIGRHLNGESASLAHEYRIRGGGDDYLWVLVRGVAERDGHGGWHLAGSQTDISARKAAEAGLRHAARHDALTGLANRLHLEELLQAVRRRPRGRDSALLFIDLDRFKLINDSLGHNAGDQVLVIVAQRLASCLRAGDHLARFGGDEFVALLGDLACAADAERVAQRMLVALRQPLQLGERTLSVSASIGIAPLMRDGQPLDALQAADLALYRAKLAGKDQFALYSDNLQVSATRQLELESALAQALAREEFVLHYQPVWAIDGARPRLVGTEALLRWRHDGELVAPAEFIAALEESREIVRVGEWVLRQACQQLRRWQEQGHAALHCAVNLSIRQLQQCDFCAMLNAVLEQTGAAPGSLVLEITETLLMQDSELLQRNLRHAAELGVRLALDDFGTGYSSLGYLRRFPLHILKVDRSFIAGAPRDADAVLLSRAIIGLGQSLGLQVIAEGVEHAEQLQFLREQGCDCAQGYFLARPLPVEELHELLGARGGSGH